MKKKYKQILENVKYQIDTENETETPKKNAHAKLNCASHVKNKIKKTME